MSGEISSGYSKAVLKIYVSLKYLAVILPLLFNRYAALAGIEFPASYDKALYEIIDLHNITAGRLIHSESRRNTGPVNMYLEYLENWNGVIETVLYEDRSKYNDYLESFYRRLGIIEKYGDRSSPLYHILLAEIYAHTGMVQIYYRDYLPGFIKLVKANHNARINMEQHPGFWLNNKLCGVLNVSFDQLSPFMRKIAGLFSLSGDLSKGFEQLAQYFDDVMDYPGLRADAMLYYGFALRISKNNGKALQFFKENIYGRPPAMMVLIFYANILAVNGKNEEARTTLAPYAGRKFEVPFPFMDYLYGKIILNHIEDKADVYLLHFLESSGSKNYKREIYNRLADHYLMHDDPKRSIYYRNLINSYAKATTDRDREADVENSRPYPPLPVLLKARYLVNGGYYIEAAEILGNINLASLSRLEYLNEYHLLLAKVEFNSGHPAEAVQNCLRTISQGRDMDEHYAAEAALLAGEISQSQGNIKMAIGFYHMALDIKGQDDVYIEIIERTAENRLNELDS